MTRIMFVCWGNICRSPMAECIMNRLIREKELCGVISCASSAATDEEIANGIGNPIFPPAEAELKKHGLSFGDHRAVQLQKSDYEKYDLIIGMDKINMRQMNELFGGDPENKLRLLGDYSGSGVISDPWYSGRFDEAYSDIYGGCEALLKYLTDNNIITP